ncbi:SF1B family DNA helicase RecD2 [Salirhabdus sp. Marseille-P4669]|uniref:SF1B family DNA helicase RecD2 n=1 Tax=Salirhabdus sp. Marseille-P4669 TaxID=2042310 RepID=UPI000C7C8DEF|nr:ATP-dependent RecD-like DNA helicase [Salirhabdus sp. Marseille-P4669]
MEQKHEEKKGYIKGKLNRTIFYNADEKFSIANVHILDTNEEVEEKEIVVKGYFLPLEQDIEYVFFGTIQYHAKFGKQYNVHTYTKDLPKTKDSLIRYLSSDLFHGVGKKTAEKLVHQLGENAIDKILKDETILETVPNFPKNKIGEFVQMLRENQGFEHVVMALAVYGIGLQLAQKIYDTFQEQTLKLLEENPYLFVFEIEGFGFRRADEIAKKVGLALDHPARIQAACLHILNKYSQLGHVFGYLTTVSEEVQQLLNEFEKTITLDEVVEKISDLAEEKYIIKEDDRVYLPSLYFSEEGLSSQLKRISDIQLTNEFSQAEIMKVLGEIEEDEELSYGTEQYEAIAKALNSKIMILTGGPGTGKTTVIKGIIGAYNRLHSGRKKDTEEGEKSLFVLAAPTGRAAKRMAEATGIKAQTIHRLLGWTGDDEFEYNHSRQLKGEVFIIDEFSMVDIWLANKLFRAIPSHAQVIIVGDEDQLPSVGPGQVLSDLLAANMLPISRLSEIYRQKEGSRIIELAHEIKNNSCAKDSLQKGEDFSFIPSSEKQLLQLIQNVVKMAVDKGYLLKDIQVLAPMYRSDVGINRLNMELQQLLNPPSNQKRSIKFNEIIFRSGDKVIQLVNQPEKGVYNGDIGEIVSILRADETEENVEQVVVNFDGREVYFVRNELNQLMHAYCISIHKSQGSEFDIVIMPVMPAYRRMLKKNLLYTAITRSKSSLIICGHAQSFLHGVQTEDYNVRNTTLTKRLQMMFDITENSTNVLPLEEEEEDTEISPYDFM